MFMPASEVLMLGQGFCPLDFLWDVESRRDYGMICKMAGAASWSRVKVILLVSAGSRDT